MKTKVLMQIVVCRDGSWNGWGYGTDGKMGEIDEAILYENWPDEEGVPDSDLAMVTVTAEVDLDALFAPKTLIGEVTKNPEDSP